MMARCNACRSALRISLNEIPEGDGEIEVFVYVVLGIAGTFRPTSEG